VPTGRPRDRIWDLFEGQPRAPTVLCKLCMQTLQSSKVDRMRKHIDKECPNAPRDIDAIRVYNLSCNRRSTLSMKDKARKQSLGIAPGSTPSRANSQGASTSQQGGTGGSQQGGDGGSPSERTQSPDQGQKQNRQRQRSTSKGKQRSEQEEGGDEDYDDANQGDSMDQDYNNNDDGNDSDEGGSEEEVENLLRGSGSKYRK